MKAATYQDQLLSWKTLRAVSLLNHSICRPSKTWSSVSVFVIVGMTIIHSLKCTVPFHSLYHLLSLAVTNCHLLSLVVIRCHSLSLVVPLVATRCHSVHHSLSFVVTRCTTPMVNAARLTGWVKPGEIWQFNFWICKQKKIIKVKLCG